MTRSEFLAELRAQYPNAPLVRVHDRVHVRGCRHALAGEWFPWAWSEGKDRAEVEAARVNGLKFCRRCDPVGIGWPS